MGKNTPWGAKDRPFPAEIFFNLNYSILTLYFAAVFTAPSSRRPAAEKAIGKSQERRSPKDLSSHPVTGFFTQELVV